ncbi:hypothetical protein K435DRAFT_972565, partial [Dendrothele bispora CBS 962.96]
MVKKPPLPIVSSDEDDPQPQTPFTPPETPLPGRSTRIHKLTARAATANNDDLPSTPKKRTRTTSNPKPPPAPKKQKISKKSQRTMSPYDFLPQFPQPCRSILPILMILLSESPQKGSADKPFHFSELDDPFSFTLQYPEPPPSQPMNTITDGQYIMNEDVLHLQSILERLRENNTAYDALNQNPDDPDKVIAAIQTTYVRELFRSDHVPDDIWETGGANLFFTQEEWDDLSQSDADRAISAITMVLGEGDSQMTADVLGDVLTFSTRFEFQVSNEEHQTQHRVFSSSTSGTSASPGSTNLSLPFDTEAKSESALKRQPALPDLYEASVMEQGLDDVTLGTETDGSITCPSSQNNLASVKPTVGLTSRAGVIPISQNQDTVGPIVRSVTDAAIVLSVIAGKDPNDNFTLAQPDVVPDYTKALKKNALVDVPDIIDETVAAAFESAVTTIKELGATVVDPADLPSAEELLVSNNETIILDVDFKVQLNEWYESLIANPSGVRSLADLIAFNDANPELEEPTNFTDRSELIESEVTTGFNATYFQHCRCCRPLQELLHPLLPSPPGLHPVNGTSVL